MVLRQVVHDQPAWEEWGDICVPIRFSTTHDGERGFVEHFWCKQLGERRFLLCCVPFAYPYLALGDTIDVAIDEDGDREIADIIHRSGHSTFHGVFRDATSATTRSAIVEEIGSLGCRIEWHSSEMFAASAL